MLKILGFDVNLINSTVYRDLTNVYDPKDIRTHCALIVKINDQYYLVDPGFICETPIYPLPLDLEKDE